MFDQWELLFAPYSLAGTVWDLQVPVEHFDYSGSYACFRLPLLRVELLSNDEPGQIHRIVMEAFKGVTVSHEPPRPCTTRLGWRLFVGRGEVGERGMWL